MQLFIHPFSFTNDLDTVRAFLSEVYMKNGTLHYLIPTKVENQKRGPCGLDYSPADDETIKVWRASSDPDAEIIAVSHRGSAGNYHIEIHPSYKDMEKDLFAQIEELERTNPNIVRNRIIMYTVDSDQKRITHLTEMGYEDTGLHEYNYEFPSNTPVPAYELPEGFKIRSIRGEDDYAAFIKVVGSVFTHCGENMTLEKMRFLAEADFFHHDLHLVATTEDDEFVGFCMYRFDPSTKIAEVEGMGVLPDFEKLDLEKAMLCEGMKSLRKKGPLLACSVEVDISDDLNQFLLSAGFVQSAEMNMWRKPLT